MTKLSSTFAVAISVSLAFGCNTSHQAVGASSEVSTEALDVALQQETQMKEQGYELEGRIWVANDAFASFFVDPGGARVGVVAGKAGGSGAALTEAFQPDESFWGYVERVKPGQYRPVADGKLSENNVFFFEPTSGAAREPSEVRSTEASVVGANDLCDINTYNAWTAFWHGYDTPATLIAETWDFRDVRSSDSSSKRVRTRNNVTGSLITACVDKGTNTLSLIHTNPRSGHPKPGDTQLSQASGWWTGIWSINGWIHYEYCASRFLGVCVDYKYKVQYGNATSKATIVPGPQSEVHFFGRYSTTPDFEDGDSSCVSANNCPTVVCQPGACPLP